MSRTEHWIEALREKYEIDSKLAGCKSLAETRAAIDRWFASAMDTYNAWVNSGLKADEFQKVAAEFLERPLRSDQRSGAGARNAVFERFQERSRWRHQDAVNDARTNAAWTKVGYRPSA